MATSHRSWIQIKAEFELYEVEFTIQRYSTRNGIQAN